MASILFYFLGMLLTISGILCIGLYARELGRNEYRYVSPESMYETTIEGRKQTFTYKEIDNLLEREFGTKNHQ